MRKSNFRAAPVAMTVVVVASTGTASANPLSLPFASGRLPTNSASLRP
jgi:hypothetical protein